MFLVTMTISVKSSKNSLLDTVGAWANLRTLKCKFLKFVKVLLCINQYIVYRNLLMILMHTGKWQASPLSRCLLFLTLFLTFFYRQTGFLCEIFIRANEDVPALSLFI